MTKKEYKQEAIKRTNWAFVNSQNIPSLLKEMAVELFITGEIITSFAAETRYRLKELKEKGLLEWD